MVSRTIRRRLQDANLPAKIAKRVPLLRPHHLRNRLDFDKSHISWNGSKDEKKWRNILGPMVNLFSSDYARNVRSRMAKEFLVRFTKKTVKHGGGNIMVYAGFS